MKTIVTTCLLVIGLTSTTWLARPASMSGPGPQAAVPAQELEGLELIGGLVKERTDEELVVTDSLDETKETRVKLTERTKYFKDGREARAEEVTVGSLVLVKATQDADDKREALEVTVIRAKVGE